MRVFEIALLTVLLVFRLSPAGADELTYLAHPPAEASAHPPLIVLLHGVGADERDMITLWRDLPRTFVVVSPRAPLAEAGGGYRWYRNGSRSADLALDRKIVDLVLENAVKRFDADPHRVFIGGFSQGAVVTYDMALHEPGRFAGAVVLSGSLFPSSVPAHPGAHAGDPTAFFIGHGTADPRIPLSAATAARTALDKLGIPTSFHVYQSMRHETGDAEIRDMAAWLREQASAHAGSP